MKIHHSHPALRKEDGMATMVFIILLSIMMILIMAETHALYNLRCEVKLMEKQQIQRLNGSPANASTITTPGTK